MTTRVENIFIVQRNKKIDTIIDVVFFSLQGAIINPFWMYRSRSVSAWKNLSLLKTLVLL